MKKIFMIMIFLVSSTSFAEDIDLPFSEGVSIAGGFALVVAGQSMYQREDSILERIQRSELNINLRSPQPLGELDRARLLGSRIIVQERRDGFMVNRTYRLDTETAVNQFEARRQRMVQAQHMRFTQSQRRMRLAPQIARSRYGLLMTVGGFALAGTGVVDAVGSSNAYELLNVQRQDNEIEFEDVSFDPDIEVAQ